MKTYYLGVDGAGAAKLESLALPFALYGPTATDRDAARAVRPEITGEYTAMQAITRSAGEVETITGSQRRYLLIILSGVVEVSAKYMSASLAAGDVIFIDDLQQGTAQLTYQVDTRAIEVVVSDAWSPEGVVPPAFSEPKSEGKVLEMFVEDGEAHFRSPRKLFAESASIGSSERVLAISFIALSPDSESDWHTEAAISLVVVLSGGFELEVGGVGGTEVLHAGDVCLIDDRSGQGHITRTHGETRIAAIVIPNEHRWVAE